MRKFLIGAAALVLSGSLATAGEALGLKVEVGLDIGVVQSIEIYDGYVDGSSMALVPTLAVTYAFDEQWSGTLWFRYLAGFDDDSADIVGDKGTVSVSGFDVGGLASCTVKVNDQFSLTPMFGLSYRSWSVDMEDPIFSSSEDCDLVVLDLGARTAYKVNDRFGITTGLMLGLGIGGSAEEQGAEGDLDGIALLLEIKGGIEYKLGDTVSFTGGLAYEMTSVTWDWYGFNLDDDLSRFSIQLGATFKF